MLFGIAFFIISIFWIRIRLVNGEIIKPFDWIYAGAFALNGIVQLLSGLGYSIERLFGKAFIRINSEVINFKIGIFEKESKIAWKDVKSIDYKSNNFKIFMLDNSKKLIGISKLDFSSIIEIKEIVKKIADDKGIKYSIN